MAEDLYGYVGGIGTQMGQTPVPYFPGMGYVGPSGPTQSGINAGMDLSRHGLLGAQSLYGQAGASMPWMDAAAQGYGGAAGLSPHIAAQQGGLAGGAMGNYGFLSSAAAAANNPYVQQMLEANRSQVQDRLLQETIPQISGMAAGSGMLGSSSSGLLKGKAIGDAAGELSRTNASMMLGAYGQGLGAQQAALGQTGAMQQALAAPMGTLGMGASYLGQAGNAVQQGLANLAQNYGGAFNLGNQSVNNMLGYGQTVEGYQQQALQDAMARYGYQYEEPWMRANNIGGAMGLLAPLGTHNESGATTGASSGTNPNYQSPFGALTQGAIGGGFMGYGLGTPGSNFMGAMGAKAPLGAAPGTSGGLYGSGGFYDQRYR
jgi:hypothetical protein